MQRKEFLKIAGLTTLSIPMMSALNKLENITDSFDSSKRMPVLFLGHGSPMNGIEDNEFVRAFKKQGQQLEMPNAKYNTLRLDTQNWLKKYQNSLIQQEPFT